VAERFRELAEVRWLDNVEVGVRLFPQVQWQRVGAPRLLERQPRRARGALSKSMMDEPRVVDRRCLGASGIAARHRARPLLPQSH